jgi:hypothetical protein
MVSPKGLPPAIAAWQVMFPAPVLDIQNQIAVPQAYCGTVLTKLG